MQQRQGDLFFRKLSRPPEDLRQRTGPEAHILARGEATGHHHSVMEADRNAVEIYDCGPACLLHVTGDSIRIEHPEHGINILEAGWHEMVIQTEEGPDEVLRRVAD